MSLGRLTGRPAPGPGGFEVDRLGDHAAGPSKFESFKFPALPGVYPGQKSTERRSRAASKKWTCGESPSSSESSSVFRVNQSMAVTSLSHWHPTGIVMDTQAAQSGAGGPGLGSRPLRGRGGGRHRGAPVGRPRRRRAAGRSERPGAAAARRRNLNPSLRHWHDTTAQRAATSKAWPGGPGGGFQVQVMPVCRMIIRVLGCRLRCGPGPLRISPPGPGAGPAVTVSVTVTVTATVCQSRCQ
jgi:hypothetical protein